MFTVLGFTRHTGKTKSNGADYDIKKIYIADDSIDNDKFGSSVLLRNYQIPLCSDELYDQARSLTGKQFQNVYFDASGKVSQLL